MYYVVLCVILWLNLNPRLYMLINISEPYIFKEIIGGNAYGSHFYVQCVGLISSTKMLMAHQSHFKT